jgi:hypothetical protein
VVTPRPVLFFRTASGRSQPLEFLECLSWKEQSAIIDDLRHVAEMGRAAAVSVKPIKGPGMHGLMEVRTGGFRAFWCFTGGGLCVLHVCRKDDQVAGIAVARSGMALLEEED